MITREQIRTNLKDIRYYYSHREFFDMAKAEIGRHCIVDMAYIMKYLEKSGEKIVYSKSLPQYFISDILEDDIACAYNDEETKYILFDDFSCWDEGVYVGQVSKDVIEQMPKANT